MVAGVKNKSGKLSFQKHFPLHLLWAVALRCDQVTVIVADPYTERERSVSGSGVFRLLFRTVCCTWLLPAPEVLLPWEGASGLFS